MPIGSRNSMYPTRLGGRQQQTFNRPTPSPCKHWRGECGVLVAFVSLAFSKHDASLATRQKPPSTKVSTTTRHSLVIGQPYIGHDLLSAKRTTVQPLAQYKSRARTSTRRTPVKAATNTALGSFAYLWELEAPTRGRECLLQMQG